MDLIFKFKIHIWDTERQRERTSTPLVHTTNVHNSWQWTRWKPGAKSLSRFLSGCHGPNCSSQSPLPPKVYSCRKMDQEPAGGDKSRLSNVGSKCLANFFTTTSNVYFKSADSTNHTRQKTKAWYRLIQGKEGMDTPIKAATFNSQHGMVSEAGNFEAIISLWVPELLTAI